MTRMLWILLMLATPAYALVPVEGILMGEATEELQSDPLNSVFSDLYDKSNVNETNRTKLYKSAYESGISLGESCSYLGMPNYSSNWQEKQARRGMAATLQYLGLDLSIKAIGSYAKKLSISQDDYRRLTQNLVKNYCSKNITVFSLKTIEKSLEHYYTNSSEEFVPYLPEANTPALLKQTTNKPSARSREFDLIIRNFRAFCSWGGEVEDYRMMTPYLNNKFIMSFVIKNMLGLRDTVDPKSLAVEGKPSESTVHVACDDLICRNRPINEFRRAYPLSAGSTGLETDLPKLFCHHFRFQDVPKMTIPQVKTWSKARELEDPIFETSQFIALYTGIPDFFSGADSYQDVASIARSSIDERWNQWANRSLANFSKDMLYEEALKVKIIPNRSIIDLSLKGFRLGFSVTLGEMDRILNSNDKLKVSFSFNLSKSYLRSIRTRWKVLEDNLDNEGQKEYIKEISRYLDLQIKQKEAIFPQKVWNDDFSRILAEELVTQARLYRGSMFETFQDEMIKVPVTFSYGLFAISYLRYKADVKAGRLKLSL